MGGRTFGTVAASAAGMGWISLKFLDFERCFVDIGQEPAGALAVEADGGNEHVAAGDLFGPQSAVPL